MATFVLEARGIPEAAEDLYEMGQRATQMRPVYDDLIDALLRGERNLWRRNGGSGQHKWPANSKRTIARKVAEGHDPRVMRRTGATERALTTRGAPGQIAFGGANELTFGVKGVGANVAQFSKNPKRRRVVLRVLPKTRKELRQIVLDHITEGLQ